MPNRNSSSPAAEPRHARHARPTANSVDAAAMLRAALTSASDGFLAVDGEDGVILAFNEQLLRVLRLDDSALALKPGSSRFPAWMDALKRAAGDPEAMIAAHWRAVHGDDRVSRARFQRQDGAEIELSTSPIVGDGGDATGRLYRYSAAATPAAHAPNDRLFETMFHSPAVGITLTDIDGRYLRANARFCEDVGYAESELIGRSFGDLTHPDDLADALKALPDMQSGEREQFKTHKRYRRRDGQYVWMQTTVSLVRDAAGRPAHFISIVGDVSAQKRAEASLRESEGRLRSLIDALPDEVVFKSMDGRWLVANAAVLAPLGVSPGEYQGCTDAELIGHLPGSAEIMAECRRTDQVAYDAGGEHRFEVHVAQPGGGERTLEVIKRIVRDAEGQPAARLCVGRDITARKQLEERVRQSERMETIGRIAAGVAHDLNNLLTAIFGSIELAQRNAPAGIADYLATIRTAASGAAALTDQLLTVARRKVVRAEPVCVGELVRGRADLLRRIVGEDVALELDAVPGDWRIWADPHQIEQVLVNLVANARDAMPRGGRVRVIVEPLQITAGDSRCADAPVGQYVRVRVQDFGEGIAPHVLPHIFEPFFSTKGSGAGTGLGLATVHGIVTQSGGAIRVDSRPGDGATFTILWPRWIDSAAQSELAAQSGKQSTSGAETILFVEDQPLVRGIGAHMLRARGFHVLEAADAPSALRLAREHQGAIDLLVTDVTLPGPHGGELAEELSKLRPGLRVLYCSGFAGEKLRRQVAGGGSPALLEKPYTPAGLAARVRAMLDAPIAG